MFDANKRLGAEDKSPGMAVVFHMGGPKRDYNPSKRLGETPSEDEAPAVSGNQDELLDKAATGICEALNVSPKAAPRLREYLMAFINAADSAPHEENEQSTEEEG